jgi:hypothetical protein
MSEEFLNYSREETLSGLIGNGTGRAYLIHGTKFSDQRKELEFLCNEVCQKENSAFWSIIDSSKVNSAHDWCSQFARNLRTRSGASPANLAQFALQTGKNGKLYLEPNQELIDRPSQLENLAFSLTSQFDQLAQGKCKLLLCIHGLDSMDEDTRTWMATSLNQSMRKLPAFQNTRFLFTTTQKEEDLKSFFNLFGFEKVRRLDASPSHEPMALHTNFAEEESIHESVPEGTTPKRLINEKLSGNLRGVGMDKSSEKIKKYFESLTEEIKQFLFLASYPTRISRYTLEHLTDSRNAALCYNWLKREKSLISTHNSGDLQLRPEIRECALNMHKESDPQTSVTWAEVSSVLNLFLEKFPVQSHHPIAINLQIFANFTQNLLRSLFSTDELSDIDDFVRFNSDLILENETGFCMSDDAKLITRRYMEVSGKLPLSGLENRVLELWQDDLSKYASKKSNMDTEKNNITDDIEKALLQVTQLKDLKNNLMENFKNPGRLKPEKMLTFSSSRALIVIGVGTIAASLLSENIGSYHAACGLALTLLGFFWPNVEFKPAEAVLNGANSSLAIETQQRSLNHRITSLCNRVEVMKRNLDDVDKQLDKLGDSPPTTYLEQIADQEDS